MNVVTPHFARASGLHNTRWQAVMVAYPLVRLSQVPAPSGTIPACPSGFGQNDQSTMLPAILRENGLIEPG